MGICLRLSNITLTRNFIIKGRKNRVLARGQSKVKNFIEMEKMCADRNDPIQRK